MKNFRRYLTSFGPTCLLAGLLLWSTLPVPAQTVGQVRDRIVRSSLDPLAVPYVWGGTQPHRGLDCSGYVLLVYGEVGLNLPRLSADQFAFTQYLKPEQVQRGDLVFFNMKLDPGRIVDHVGIYLGAGYFAHASFSRGVIIDDLRSPYYRRRLRGIRRHRALSGG